MSVPSLHGGECLRVRLLVIQNDIRDRNSPEDVDAESRVRSGDEQMRQPTEIKVRGY